MSIAKRTTEIDSGELFQGADSDEWIRELDAAGQYVTGHMLSSLLPAEAQNWSRGRFTIEVTFTPEDR